MPTSRTFPSQALGNVAAAIYGLILGSSIIAAVSAEHPGQPRVVELYVCVTALVFYLAHVYARVIGSWIEGEPPSIGSVQHELRRESPMVSSQLVPAAVLLLGALGVISGRLAITVALVAALAELMLGVLFACRKAKASLPQAIVSVSIAVVFAVLVILLKVLVHGSGL